MTRGPRKPRLLTDQERKLLQQLELREHQERLAVASIKIAIRKARKYTEEGRYRRAMHCLLQADQMIRLLFGL